MAYDGKIAGHFPGRGNPNLDTLSIHYLAEGASTPSSISDMQKIQEVYACRAGETLTLQNLEDHLVWRYFDELLNDTTQGEYLMFAFKPEHNISVNSLGIFTDGNGNASNALVICSDDGLLLYKGDNTQESTENTEIYGLSGIKRTRTFGSAITLYAGKTYWIHYHFSDCRNYRGAYFNGFNGHACLGKYKNFGDFDFVNFANQTAYPQYADLKLGSWVQITAYAPNDITNALMACAENTAIYQSDDVYQSLYVRNNAYTDHAYKGRIHADGTGSDTQWGISQNDWDGLGLETGDYFIIGNRYNYDQEIRLCQCTDPTGDPNSSYTIIFQESNTNTIWNYFTKIKFDQKVSFIQYYNNKAAANYWNQTYTDKRYYLEINGIERGAGDERK